MSTTTSEKSAHGPSDRDGGMKRNDSDGTQVVLQDIVGEDSDEAELARMGYKQEFAREFTNLSVSRLHL